MAALAEETTADYRTRPDVGALVVRALVYALGQVESLEAEDGEPQAASRDEQVDASREAKQHAEQTAA